MEGSVNFGLKFLGFRLLVQQFFKVKIIKALRCLFVRGGVHNWPVQFPNRVILRYHPATRLFVDSFVQTNNEENMKSPHHWPFVREATGDWCIRFTNGQWCGKLFHIMAHHEMWCFPIIYYFYGVHVVFSKMYFSFKPGFSLRWRHNGHDSVSNHQPHHCLLSRLFRRRLKKTSKLRVTGLCVGNSPGPVNSPHKWPLTRKMFSFDDVIMCVNLTAAMKFSSSWHIFLMTRQLHNYFQQNNL